MEQEPELADADAQIEALDEQLTTRASQIRMDSETPVRLTMQLIRQSTSHAQRPQDPEDQQDRKDDDDDREEEREIESMLLRRVLRLDWLNIGRIENLDAFTHVQELYLQHNLIERIENLDDHSELTFLALGDNRIRKVENLRQLTKLKFLDLSSNCIEDFDIREFPASLRILRMAGNPFVRHMPSYVHLFFERLPNLVQIDHFRRAEDLSIETQEASTPPSSIFSPRSRCVDFETEVELHEGRVARSSSTATGGDEQHKPEAAAVAPLNFDVSAYEATRQQRVDKWKQQLKDLETRKAEWQRHEELPVGNGSKTAADVMMMTASSSRAHRNQSKRLERTRAGTKSAIAESISHFQEMELQHKEWQDACQQQQSSPAS